MTRLTKIQRAYLRFLIGYAAKFRTQPTTQEVADRFHVSREGARGHLLALERKGFILYAGRGPRNLRVLKTEE